MMPIADSRADAAGRGLELARVLLVESDVASRLTLQTLLQAGGYSVDVAASAAEAVGKLDESTYELVLTDSQMESDAGRSVLAYARRKEYKPATALIHKHREGSARNDLRKTNPRMTVEAEDVTTFLSKVAELISLRATRRTERALRSSVNN
ncbi:MAG TPA: response regulator [Bryobacteraceae bacterium]|nr:response regulator [Bryobacteraceae bacterium]